MAGAKVTRAPRATTFLWSTPVLACHPLHKSHEEERVLILRRSCLLGGLGLGSVHGLIVVVILRRIIVAVLAPLSKAPRAFFTLELRAQEAELIAAEAELVADFLGRLGLPMLSVCWEEHNELECAQQHLPTVNLFWALDLI